MSRLPDGNHLEAQPGDYWKQPHTAGGLDGEHNRDWRWVVITPNGHQLVLPHAATEYPDGTITFHDIVPDLRPVHHIGWELKNGQWIDLGSTVEDIDPEAPIATNQQPPSLSTAEERRAWLRR